MMIRRFSRAFSAALFCLLGVFLLMHTHHRSMRWSVIAASVPNDMPGGGMAHMAGHMYMTPLRAPQAGDQQKADAIAAAAKEAMAPYQDYRKALADGSNIFLPHRPQANDHFT